MAAPRVLLPAATTLVAGFLLGWAAASGRTAAAAEELPPDLLAWERAVSEALELRPAQRDDLRILLFHYRNERERMLHRHLAEADEDWSALYQRFEDLLQARILDPRQQELAADLSRPRPVVDAAPPR